MWRYFAQQAKNDEGAAWVKNGVLHESAKLTVPIHGGFHRKPTVQGGKNDLKIGVSKMAGHKKKGMKAKGMKAGGKMMVKGKAVGGVMKSLKKLTKGMKPAPAKPTPAPAAPKPRRNAKPGTRAAGAGKVSGGKGPQLSSRGTRAMLTRMKKGDMPVPFRRAKGGTMKAKGMMAGGKMKAKGMAKGGKMATKSYAKGGAAGGMRKPSNKNSGLYGR